LAQTVEQARAAVREMETAGKASALIIEKATRLAVSEAVSDALKAVRDQTASTIKGSVGPSVTALESATGRATQAGEELREAANSISWKWTGLWALTGCLLLLTIVGLSMLLVPSPSEIADLRANAENLEARGGKVVLTLCGPQKRLCAEVDNKAEAWGENGQFRILKGY
ncbi:hypothetical protein, partial [Pseudomonas helleri]|uniref:hypothetical protein n=1 Tax=Pseudomonas helleri TaxID=1608996 RepID=UPI001885AED3